MIITRIDSESKEKKVKRIDISLDIHSGFEGFVITEEFGELKIHKKAGKQISVHPCVSNEILVK